MADTIKFTEGLNELANNGLPSTCYFLLSTKACSGVGGFVVGDTLAGGVGEITGTGYARQTESEPTAVAGVVTFAAKAFATSTATDWPSSAKSIVLVTTSGNTGKAICAWNLQAGGIARDLSGANTTETFTPTLAVA